MTTPLLSLFLTLALSAYAVDPLHCLLGRLGAKQKQTDRGNAPSQNRDLPKGYTRVEYLDGDAEILITATGRDEQGSYRTESRMVKRADGKYDVTTTKRETGKADVVTQSVADRPPETMATIQQKNWQKILQARAEHEAIAYRDRIVREFKKTYGVSDADFGAARDEAKEFSRQKGLNWTETDVVVHALPFALVKAPPKVLVSLLKGGIELMGFDREAVTDHLDGKRELVDTIFDPAQERYVEIVQAMTSLRSKGKQAEMDQLKETLLSRLIDAGTFPR